MKSIVRTACAVAWTIFLLSTLFSAKPPGPMPFDHADKVVHATLFVGYGWLWSWSGLRPRTLIASAVLLAVLTELGQGWWLIHRVADPLDVVSDLVGLGLGLGAWRFIERRTGRTLLSDEDLRQGSPRN